MFHDLGQKVYDGIWYGLVILFGIRGSQAGADRSNSDKPVVFRAPNGKPGVRIMEGSDNGFQARLDNGLPVEG